MTKHGIVELSIVLQANWVLVMVETAEHAGLSFFCWLGRLERDTIVIHASKYSPTVNVDRKCCTTLCAVLYRVLSIKSLAVCYHVPVILVYLCNKMNCSVTFVLYTCCVDVDKFYSCGLVCSFSSHIPSECCLHVIISPCCV